LDLKETMELQPRTKRPSAINDIRLLSMENEAKSYSAPANQIIARGIKIKIKDLEERGVPDELKTRSNVRFTNLEVGVQGDKHIIVPSFGTTTALFQRHF
jgi:hypothetical protein